MVNQEIYPPVKTEPRFFYGYIVVIAAFFIFVVSFGIYDSFGVFFKPLQTELGWTRAMTSGAFSLSMFVYGIFCVVMGGLNDRFGPRMIMTLCGFFLGLGYLLMSQVRAFWQINLFYGVIIGVGMSGLRIPLLSTIARWFVKRRSLMTGIVVAGMGIGHLIAPPVLSRLIAAYDWRISYIIVGGAVLVVNVIAAQFLRRDPTHMGQLPYGGNDKKEPELESENKSFSLKEASYTAQFWLFIIMSFCFGFCTFAVMVHIVPHAIDLEISAISAANILASIGGMGIIGNLALGSLGDRIGNRWIFIIGFILMSAALFWLVLTNEVRIIYLSAVVFGFAHGGISPSGPPLLAWLFGLSSHGLLLGVVGLGFTSGAAVGPILTGYIFDITGSYQLAFLVCTCVAVSGLISAVILRPTKRMGGRI